MDDGGAPAKRARGKAREKQPVKKRPRPRLFAPFRALGLVTDHVPVVVQVQHGGKDAKSANINIVASVGHSWVMWDGDRMTLLFVGQSLPQPIQSLALAPGSGGVTNVLATAGDSVYRFVRGAMVQELKAEVPLSTLTTIGDNIISLSVSGQDLFFWSLLKGNLQRHIQLSRPMPNGSDDDDLGTTFSATAMLHPSTYIDKLLIGGASGDLQLWNTRTATLIHHFSAAKLLSYLGLSLNERSAIVDLVQTPAIDIVAVAFASGHVLLVDIRYDEPILCAHITSTSNSAILSKGALAFRTDNMAHTMAIGTRLGDIVLFDLDAPGSVGSVLPGRARPARLAHTLRSAHDSSVASLHFLPGQPLLLSSGSDNAIKQWFFEVSSINAGSGSLGGQAEVGSTTAPRLLKYRAGHSQPPRLIRYMGPEGKTILSSGGEDRSVRAMSVVRDSRSAELSQGSVERSAKKLSTDVVSLKVSPTTSLAFSTTRSRDWDDILSTHASSPYAQTWFLRDRRKGKSPLLATNVDAPTNDGVPAKASNAGLGEATASCVSACGNFGMVGNSHGFVEVYNMQSGRWRRRYDTRALIDGPVKTFISKAGVRTERREKQRARASAVVAVASDSVNRTVLVATLDGTLHFFDFGTAQLVQTIQTGSGIAAMQLEQNTNLIATVHDDLQVRMYDIETFKLVRTFTGFRARILDMTFSPDGRWLIVSSLDGAIRTFDVPSGLLVDAFRPPSVATSLTFSPTADFLATTHVGSLGIFLWANRAQFTSVNLVGLEEEAVFDEARGAGIELPTMRGMQEDGDDRELETIDVGEGELQRAYASQPQLFSSKDPRAVAESDGLMTLSTMSRSRWMTLLNLDAIRQRDKPVEAPKKPERAPFFLPQASEAPESAIIRRPGLGDELAGEEQDVEATRRLRSLRDQGGLEFESDLSKRMRMALDEEEKEATIEGIFVYLHSLSPPALDGDIRASLGRVVDITRFLRVLTARLRQKRDYEAVQAMLAVLLRVHGDVIVANGVKPSVVIADQMIIDGEQHDDNDDVEVNEEGRELGQALRELIVEQNKEGQRVMELLDYCTGSLAFVRNVPLSY